MANSIDLQQSGINKQQTFYNFWVADFVILLRLT